MSAKPLCHASSQDTFAVGCSSLRHKIAEAVLYGGKLYYLLHRTRLSSAPPFFAKLHHLDQRSYFPSAIPWSCLPIPSLDYPSPDPRLFLRSQPFMLQLSREAHDKHISKIRPRTKASNVDHLSQANRATVCVQRPKASSRIEASKVFA